MCDRCGIGIRAAQHGPDLSAGRRNEGTGQQAAKAVAPPGSAISRSLVPEQALGGPDRRVRNEHGGA